ncbi:NUDIX hydrolase [Planococcus lenghuensis]|uniref:DNA mismatch repair protein MutT n=1 Tax=Planococcus lenghuensis TaxID=2213202 RepID=A0A1Q2KWN7_9BACL|nr:NUDIX domain-containing protein [Planococcus lenghuensis]AQQ52628.1 DNA mismatch repair protein MutT [Planococcus lenghuensis]
MMRNRGAAVIIQNGQVVLIKRVREGITYYVFPGGGIEEGETPEQAAGREAFEELGVTVEVTELLTTMDHDGKQFFFTAGLLTGAIGKGTGEEFTDLERGRGTYEPMWVPIDQLSSLDLRPKRIGTLLLEKERNDDRPS